MSGWRGLISRVRCPRIHLDFSLSPSVCDRAIFSIVADQPYCSKRQAAQRQNKLGTRHRKKLLVAVPDPHPGIPGPAPGRPAAPPTRPAPPPTLEETTTQGVDERRLETLTDSTAPAAPSAPFHQVVSPRNSSCGGAAWGR